MAFITEGFPTTMAFANADSGVTLYFKEKELTPPGIDGGGPNDYTSMRNTAWRTRQPKQLKTLTAASLTCFYDPTLLTGILALVNVNQEITITFPDSHTWTFWGWIDKFTPSGVTEGNPAEATVTIEVSNIDSGGSEIAPAYA